MPNGTPFLRKNGLPEHVEQHVPRGKTPSLRAQYYNLAEMFLAECLKVTPRVLGRKEMFELANLPKNSKKFIHINKMHAKVWRDHIDGVFNKVTAEEWNISLKKVKKLVQQLRHIMLFVWQKPVVEYDDFEEFNPAQLDILLDFKQTRQMARLSLKDSISW